MFLDTAHGLSFEVVFSYMGGLGEWTSPASLVTEVSPVHLVDAAPGVSRVLYKCYSIFWIVVLHDA